MKHRQEKNLPVTIWNEQASIKIKQKLAAVTAKIEKVLFKGNDLIQFDDSQGDKHRGA